MNLEAEKTIDSVYPQLLRAAVLLTGNRAEAEDLAQESILKALSGWNRFRGESSRKTWMYSVLLNLHKKQLRSQQRRWGRWLTWFDRSNATAIPSPHEVIVAAEWKRSLWSAVSRLPTPQQHVVVLRFTEQLTYDEIAEVIGCPSGTVKSRLSAALKKLNRELVKAPEFQAIVNNE